MKYLCVILFLAVTVLSYLPQQISGAALASADNDQSESAQSVQNGTGAVPNRKRREDSPTTKKTNMNTSAKKPAEPVMSTNAIKEVKASSPRSATTANKSPVQEITTKATTGKPSSPRSATTTAKKSPVQEMTIKATTGKPLQVQSTTRPATTTSPTKAPVTSRLTTRASVNSRQTTKSSTDREATTKKM